MSKRPDSLFYRLCWRSLRVRRSQALVGFGSLAVGAAVCSLLLCLYGGVERKMSQSFSAFGANVVVAPRATSQASSGLPSLMAEPSQFQALERRLPGVAMVPVLYAVVGIHSAGAEPRFPEGQRLVAVGSDLGALWRMYPSWRLESIPGTLGIADCAVGRHVAKELGLHLGDQLELQSLSAGSPEANAPSATFRVATIVSTGAAEDSQIFVPLRALERLTNTRGKISAMELRISGNSGKIEAAVRVLAALLPEAQVRPVRQIVYSQGKVLGTLSRLMLALTTLILVIIALSVASAMTAMVMERGKEIGLMKALGASDRAVMGLFLGEAAGLGLAGGAAGFVVGAFLAREVAYRFFDVPLTPSGWIFPLICLSTMLLAIVATFLPVVRVRGIEPALALRQ